MINHVLSNTVVCEIIWNEHKRAIFFLIKRTICHFIFLMLVCGNIETFSIGFVGFDSYDYMLEEHAWLLEIKLWYINNCRVWFTTVAKNKVWPLQSVWCTQDCKLWSCSDGLLGSLTLCEIVKKYCWWDYNYGCSDPKKPNCSWNCDRKLIFLKNLGFTIENEQKIYLFRGVPNWSLT